MSYLPGISGGAAITMLTLRVVPRQGLARVRMNGESYQIMREKSTRLIARLYLVGLI